MKITIFTGLTASGKSSYAENLYSDGVIINADSMQMYKDLPVLSASPDFYCQNKSFNQKDCSQSNVIPFNNSKFQLYSVLSPDEHLNVNQWLQMCVDAIQRAVLDNQKPIVVGGTVFYVNILVNFLDHIKTKSNKYHKVFEKIIYNRDVFEDFKLEVIALLPSKKTIKSRIKNRLDNIMLKNNIVLKEVESLIGLYKENPLLPVFHTIGFKEITEYIEGKINKDNMIDKIIYKTLKYAKHQRTFIKNVIKCDLILV